MRDGTLRGHSFVDVVFEFLLVIGVGLHFGGVVAPFATVEVKGSGFAGFGEGGIKPARVGVVVLLVCAHVGQEAVENFVKGLFGKGLVVFAGWFCRRILGQPDEVAAVVVAGLGCI